MLFANNSSKKKIEFFFLLKNPNYEWAKEGNIIFVLGLYLLFGKNIEVLKVETIKVTIHCTCQNCTKV
jgi:hypothetical protein